MHRLATISLPRGDADNTITELLDRLMNAVKTVRLPAFPMEAEAATAGRDQVLAIVRERCAALVKDAG